MMETTIRVIFALGLLAATWNGRSADQEIVVAYIDKPNPPFVLDPDVTGGARPGITLELLHRLEQRLPIRFRYRSLPWARCLQLLKSNEVDAVFHSSFIPERMEAGVYPMRDEQIDPDRRLVTQSYFVYRLRDSPLNWDGERFTGLLGSIGTIIGFSVNNDLQRVGLSLEQAPSISANLRKLLAGRVDAVVNYDSQTDAAIQQQPEEFAKVVKIPSPYKIKFKYLMFSYHFYQAHQAVAEAVWDELKRLRESGEYVTIAEKYGSP